MNFGADLQYDTDSNNNLSGNAGISKEYYNKQVLQFLKLRQSAE
jgi:hypothetical protein